MPLRRVALNMTSLFLGLVQGFLGLRFVLLLFGANSSNGFVSWVYDMSSVLLEPFRGIFPTRVFESTYVFEFSTIFAMLAYAVAGLLIVALIEAVSSPVSSKKK